MANFAVVKDGIVLNVIIAESKDVAENITGTTCVEYMDTDRPHAGLGYSNGVFEQPQAEETE